MELQAITGILAAAFILAVFTEGVVEYFFGEYESLKGNLHWIALFVAMAVCIAYDVDLFAVFGLETRYGIISNILSAFIIARGSNYTNDFLTHRVRPRDTLESR